MSEASDRRATPDRTIIRGRFLSGGDPVKPEIKERCFGDWALAFSV
jgi:hypothetical protein